MVYLLLTEISLDRELDPIEAVMKVLTFIVSVIRVKLPKITLHLLFFVSDDLWMFCVSVVLFLFNYFFVIFFVIFSQEISF